MATVLYGIMSGVTTVSVFSVKVSGGKTLREKILLHAGTLRSDLSASRESEETVRYTGVL